MIGMLVAIAIAVQPSVALRLAPIDEGAKVVPHTINYQGYLTSNNNPISDTVEMVFSIYDASSGGNMLWTSNRIYVPVENGVFNVLLGGNNPIPANLFDGSPKWLQIEVENTVLSPRQKLVSVGYSFRAIWSDTAESVSYTHLTLPTKA